MKSESGVEDNKEITEEGMRTVEKEGGGDISINRKQQETRGATVRRNGWQCDGPDSIRNSSTFADFGFM